MRIAIIGTGVAGLIAGRRLHELGHDVTLFEKEDRIGGHVRTVRVPIRLPNGQTELFPVEHGVFMHDPKMIHPLMNEYIRNWQLRIRPFPLTFSYQNENSGFAWTTKTGTSGRLRELAILYKTACQSLPNHTFIKNVKYLLELRRFIHHWEEIASHPRFRQMTIAEFLTSERYSDRFRAEWLLPQVHCWWGVPESVLPSVNIQVVADPMLKVSLCPQYIFVDGWDTFVQKIAEPVQDRIHLAAPVSAVERSATSVRVTVTGGVATEFDHVIFATPPGICAATIAGTSEQEDQLLRSFLTIETEVFLHTDANWMPHREKWATANLIQGSKGQFSTLWYGELHAQKPPIFVTWGTPLQQPIAPDKIIDTKKMLRTLPTNAYASSCRRIRDIQGQGGIWYCGAHVDALSAPDQYAVPSLWHENALRSGLDVALRVHAAPARKQPDDR